VIGISSAGDVSFLRFLNHYCSNGAIDSRHIGVHTTASISVWAKIARTTHNSSARGSLNLKLLVCLTANIPREVVEYKSKMNHTFYFFNRLTCQLWAIYIPSCMMQKKLTKTIRPISLEEFISTL